MCGLSCMVGAIGNTPLFVPLHIGVSRASPSLLCRTGRPTVNCHTFESAFVEFSSTASDDCQEVLHTADAIQELANSSKQNQLLAAQFLSRSCVRSGDALRWIPAQGDCIGELMDGAFVADLGLRTEAIQTLANSSKQNQLLAAQYLSLFCVNTGAVLRCLPLRRRPSGDTVMTREGAATVVALERCIEAIQGLANSSKQNQLLAAQCLFLSCTGSCDTLRWMPSRRDPTGDGARIESGAVTAELELRTDVVQELGNSSKQHQLLAAQCLFHFCVDSGDATRWFPRRRGCIGDDVVVANEALTAELVLRAGAIRRLAHSSKQNQLLAAQYLSRVLRQPWLCPGFGVRLLVRSGVSDPSGFCVQDV